MVRRSGVVIVEDVIREIVLDGAFVEQQLGKFEDHARANAVTATSDQHTDLQEILALSTICIDPNVLIIFPSCVIY